MKKTFLLGFVALFCMSSVVADWITVKIDDSVSVDFPTQPKIQDLGGNQVWIADAGPNMRCMSMKLDFNNYGMDSAMMAQQLESAAFSDGFRDAMLDRMEGASLISEKKNTVLGYPALEYVIDLGKKDTSQLNIMYNQNIFVGAKMYTLNFFEKTSKPQDAEKQKFLSSLKIAQ